MSEDRQTPIRPVATGPEPTRQVTLARGVPRWAGIGIFAVLCIWALDYGQAFLTPVVLAVLLALVFSPMRRFLERLRLAPGIAALLIVGALLGGLVAGLSTLAGPASRWMDDAPRIGFELRQKLGEMREATEGVREAAEQVDEIAEGSDEAEPGEEEVQRVRVEEPGLVSRIALTTPAVLAQIVFTLVLLFFLLASGDMFYEKVVHSMPTFSDKRRAVRIARDIERKLSRYFFTITVINSGLGVAIGLTMWALGMPNPVLIGVGAAFLNFVPYLGAFMGVTLVLIAGLVTFSTAADALVAAGAYFALTSFEGQFVTPYFVGRSLRLNTVVVFLSVSFWAWLWSAVGMLLATPLLVTVRTLSEHVPSLRGLGGFLSDGRAEADDP